MSVFTISYRLTLQPGEEIDAKIDAICLEQSVELPRSVLSAHISEHIVGKPVDKKQISDNQFDVDISWPVANIGEEVTQFLNILFGNISLNPGIQITDVDWNALPSALFAGPSHGIDGVRSALGIPDRALSCTALKPMGTSSEEFGRMTYEFALGGMDIIKDDHGLSNQSYAPYESRLNACVEATQRASQETGRNVWYVPHISAGGDELWRRYERAAKRGVGAVMICPQLCSPTVMSEIAALPDALPVMAHPAFSGAYVQDPQHGFTKGFLYGSLWRAMGADFVIYPNHAGRFSFTQHECDDINHRARSADSRFKSAWPTPGGGMQRETLPQWIQRYGKNTVFLIGGSLYKHPSGIRAAASEIKQILEETSYEK